MQLSFGFHVIGAILWIGGLMVVTGLIRYFESHADARQGPAYKALTKKYWFGFVVPGFVISITSGLYQILSNGISFYMQQGWFHGKLTFLVLLLIITLFVGIGVSAVQKGETLPAKRFGMLHGFVGMCLLGIIFLTYLGRH